MSVSSKPPKVVSAWATENGFLLITDERSPGRSYFYLSSEKGATFQIVIEPILSIMARIDAHLIEGPDNEEAHFIWEFSWARINHGLDLAVSSARCWFERLV